METKLLEPVSELKNESIWKGFRKRQRESVQTDQAMMSFRCQPSSLKY